MVVSFFMLFSAISRERLFVLAMLAYLGFSATLASCVSSRPGAVAHLETRNSVGLPAEEVCAPDAPTAAPLPPTRRQRRQAARTEKRETHRDRATYRKMLLNWSKPAPAATVKLKNVGNDYFDDHSSSKQKDQSTTRQKDQSEHGLPPKTGTLPAAAWLLPWVPYLIGSAVVCWLLSFNPFKWVAGLIVGLFKRKRQEHE